MVTDELAIAVVAGRALSSISIFLRLRSRSTFVSSSANAASRGICADFLASLASNDGSVSGGVLKSKTVENPCEEQRETYSATIGPSPIM
jgi:hypothetical protein